MGGHAFHPDPIRLSSVQFQNPDVRARPAITLRSNLLVPIGSEEPETPIHRNEERVCDERSGRGHLHHSVSRQVQARTM